MKPWLSLLWLGLPLALPAMEQRLTLRDGGAVARNSSIEVPAFDPATFKLKPKPLFESDWQALQQHSLRYDGSLGGSEGLRLEWNLLATLDLQSHASPLPPPLQPSGRSAVLQHRFLGQPGEQLDAEADQLALRWQSERWNAALGRQSVNLGENFYFSPLDLFLPFVAQQSYRDFRPGVDALRATYSPSAFSLVELIAVAGYAPLALGTNTSDQPLDLDGDHGRGSLLLRGKAGGQLWSGTLLAGRVRQEELLGLAGQLELAGASWTLEELQAQSLVQADGAAESQRVELTLGLARQVNAWSNLRAEFNWTLGRQGGQDQARSQACLSDNLQVGPLLTLGPALFWYPVDRNAAASLVADLSVSDQSVLEMGLYAPILVPGQDGPGNSPVELAPHSFSLELRTVL